MSLLHSWTRLELTSLLALMLPAGILILSLFLPGRRVARGGAAGMVLAVLLMGDVVATWPLGVGWAALWAVVAWWVGAPVRSNHRWVARPGGVESGMVGLLLGLVLLALLVGAVARQHLSPEYGRSASLGLLLMCLGLLHLMLRRDAVRAMVAFAALGLGLQVLERAASGMLVKGDSPPPGMVLLATVVAVGLVERLGRVRERDTGSSWVSDAHDLHD